MRSVGKLFFSVTVLLGAFALGNIAGDKLLSWRDVQTRKNLSTSSPVASRSSDLGSDLPKVNIRINGKELIVPENNATDAQKDEFTRLVRSMAKSTNTIRIEGGCALIPAVIRVTEGSQLIFENGTNSEQNVSILNMKIIIPGNGSKKVPVSFENGKALYGIVCDEKTLNGFVDVVAQ